MLGFDNNRVSVEIAVFSNTGILVENADHIRCCLRGEELGKGDSIGLVVPVDGEAGVPRKGMRGISHVRA